MEFVKTEHAPAAVGAYSQATVAGGFLFTAGQIGLDPKTGAIVDGGVQAQAHRALANLRAILEAAGIRNILTKQIGSRNPHNVVKATVEGLRQLRSAEQFAAKRGLTVPEVLGMGPAGKEEKEDQEEKGDE